VSGESGTDDGENVEIFLFVCSRCLRDLQGGPGI
jgi:hypothetical protein